MLPPGSVIAFAGEASPPPAGWLLCDGSPQSSRTFPALHAAIKNTHGGGYNVDGTHATGCDFNLPDYRGVFLRGADSKDHTGAFADKDPETAQRTALRDDGNSGQKGNTFGTYQKDEFEKHSHIATVSPNPHDHAYRQPGSSGSSGEAGNSQGLTWQATTSADLTVTVADKGVAIETRPKNVTVFWMIRAIP